MSDIRMTRPNTSTRPSSLLHRALGCRRPRRLTVAGPTANGRRWPLMIIPYVGTTKALVALPLFALFGITPETARFSGVVLGCVGIAGLVTLSSGLKSAPPGCAPSSGPFLAIHPSYVDLTVFDNGGVSVWMAAMGIALGADEPLPSPDEAVRLSAWNRRRTGCLGSTQRALAHRVRDRGGPLRVRPARHPPPKAHIRAMDARGLLRGIPARSLRSGLGARDPPIHRGRTAAVVGRSEWPHLLRETAELMISDGEQRGIWAGPQMPSWQIGVGAVLLVSP